MKRYQKINKRIREVLNTSITDQNCIGTALFIAEMAEKDCYIEPEDAGRFLEGLVKVEKPEIGCLAVWEYRSGNIKKVVHMGIVVDTDMTKITHRDGYCAALVRNEPLESVSSIWKCQSTEIRFYRPVPLYQNFSLF